MRKVALITGANGGIGSSTAFKLGENGYKLILNDYVNANNVQKIQKHFGEENVVIVNADVTKENEVKNMVDIALDRFQRIDVLVNNAGIISDAKFTNMSLKMWNDVIDVNLNGVFITTRAVYESMIRNKYGVIINMSSIVGEYGNFGQTNYATTKAALLGFTKSLAIEGAKDGIRVNSIAPGFIDTDMTANIPLKVKEILINKIPLKRFAKPEEIAKAVLFICECEYMTGSILDINGGLHI